MVRIITMAHSTRFSSSSRILVALVAGLLSLLCGEEGVLHVQSFSTIVSFHSPTSLTTKTKATTTTTRYITHTIGSTVPSSSTSFPSLSSSTLFSTVTEAETDTEVKVETDVEIDIDRSNSIPTTKITIEKDIVVDVVDDAGVSSQPTPQESSTSTSESSSESESTSLYDSLSEVLLGPNKYRQLLEFVEPTTNVTVLLIGSMHYNPASIALVEQTVDKLGLDDKLGSVIIESCDVRWNKTQTIRDKKNTKLQEKLAKQVQAASSSTDTTTTSVTNITLNKDDLLGNEMVAAWEVASKYNRPTVLGDQRINITMDALKANFKDTLSDIFLKGPKGWKHSYTEIVEGWEQTIPIDVSRNNKDGKNNNNNNSSKQVQNLNALAFFDPRLLISLPVSLVKYPLSFLLKDPLPFTLFFGTIAGLSYYLDHTGQLYDLTSSSLSSLEVSGGEPHSIASYLVSLVFSLLETVIFARLLLKPLLAERNEILAKSIFDQCTIYSTTMMDETSSTNGNGDTNSNWFEQFFFKLTGGTNKNNNNNSNKNEQNMDTDDVDGIVYVPGSSPSEMKMKSTTETTTTTTTTFYEGKKKEGKVVVAVLGMAHCNGVMKLLTEQRV
mmetsp:Transcript_42362/g.47348  ORF Transcript_42362/g.47348 Transcript_42362/m.47348 type:complete len:610 (-) Transcript_42362:135-1964(-)